MKSMLGLTETFRLSPQVRAHSQSSGCEHVRRRDNVVTRNQDIRRQPCSVGNRRHTPQIYYRVWKIIMRRVIEVLAVAAALMMANASVAAQLNEAETALLSAVHKIRQDPIQAGAFRDALSKKRTEVALKMLRESGAQGLDGMSIGRAPPIPSGKNGGIVVPAIGCAITKIIRKTKAGTTESYQIHCWW